MEQRRARHQVRHALASTCAALVSLASASGCWVHPQQLVTPAARRQGEDRGMALLPPLELVSPRDAIVRVVATGNVTCTGTLIADDLVLTAHHCVAARDKKGRVQSRDMAPEEIGIELGGDYLPWGEAKVRAVVAPQCGYASGDGDIAILVLERRLIGMPTYAVRIESAPELKDVVSLFGFGRCALSPDGIQRRARDDTKIEAVAPGHFVAQASVCPGDSGGPVLSSRMDIVGVISASVMDANEHVPGTSLFTRADAWRQLFAAAHEISNGASPSELPPFGDCKAPPAARPAPR